MALINYNDIDFNKSINKENKIIEFNGSEIEVVPYLSVNDKYNLIMITLQKALENNIYNFFKIDIYFDLHIVFLYTNIVFSKEDRADEVALYDTLKRSGLMDMILNSIDANELAYLKDCILKMSDMIMNYRNTFGSVVSNVIGQLPENMKKVQSILENIDPQKYQELLSVISKVKQG